MLYQSILLPDRPYKTTWLAMLGMVAIACVLPAYLVQIFKPHPIQYHPTARLFPALIHHAPTAKPLSELNIRVSSLLSPPPEATSANIRILTIQKGDTLERLFKRVGLSNKHLQEVLQHQPSAHHRLLKRLRPGQHVTLTITNGRLTQLVWPYSFAESLVITEQAQHYVSSIQQKPSITHRQSIAATLRGSLYNTAKKKHIPFSLIQQMVSILNREIDFKKGIRTGDHFNILYEASFIEDKLMKVGPILAVRYINKGNTHEAVRYTNKDGSSNYFTPQGLSLKKAYDRYPVRFSHIASPFSLSRYHPILHYRRPHYGIDLAAPVGTPIHAIGDGRIEVLHWRHGYGNMIKIRHNDMYSTVYGHLSRFEKGLLKGNHVKRGQVIGYVGQTGLASGPHCHFEFHKYRHPINPSTIQLPHADPVPHHEMAKFKNTVKRFFAQFKLPGKKTLHG